MKNRTWNVMNYRKWRDGGRLGGVGLGVGIRNWGCGGERGGGGESRGCLIPYKASDGTQAM